MCEVEKCFKDRSCYAFSSKLNSLQISVCMNQDFFLPVWNFTTRGTWPKSRERPLEPQEAAASKCRRMVTNPKEPRNSSPDSRDEDDKPKEEDIAKQFVQMQHLNVH